MTLLAHPLTRIARSPEQFLLTLSASNQRRFEIRAMHPPDPHVHNDLLDELDAGLTKVSDRLAEQRSWDDLTPRVRRALRRPYFGLGKLLLIAAGSYAIAWHLESSIAQNSVVAWVLVSLPEQLRRIFDRRAKMQELGGSLFHELADEINQARMMMVMRMIMAMPLAIILLAMAFVAPKPWSLVWIAAAIVAYVPYVALWGHRRLVRQVSELRDVITGLNHGDKRGKEEAEEERP